MLLRQHPCYTNGGHCDCPSCIRVASRTVGPAGGTVATWAAVALVASAALWVAAVNWLGPWLVSAP